MNRKERRSKNNNKVINKNIKSLKGASDIAIETENSFRAWLEYSEMNEETFLSYSENRLFDISKEIMGGVEIVTIGSYKDGEYSVIGEPFISSADNENEMFEINMALMLFHLATKLDNAYANNPEYPERTKTGCDYFYKQVKEFVNNNFKVKK